MKTTLRCSALLLVFCSLAMPCNRGSAAEVDDDASPNIIMILADDLGFADLSCYGSENVKTPRLDQMAQGGLRFNDFHSNGAVCSPTRAALMTGRYQQRSGISGVVSAAGHRDVGLAIDELTMGDAMLSAGYRTGIFGKWHLGYDVKFNPARNGFEQFRGYVSGNVDYQSHLDQTNFRDWWINDTLKDEPGYTTELITDHALRFLEQNRDRRFFLYIPHETPHSPNQGPYDRAIRAPRDLDQAGKRAFLDEVNARIPDAPDDYVKHGSVRTQMIEFMDGQIGRVLDKVDELGLSRDTLIFFCSDNGPAGDGSAGPYRGKKGSVYEGGHRVSAIAYWPGRIEPGGVTDATVMTMDLLPTFAELGGVELPESLELDGVSIVPVLDGEPLECERTLYWWPGPSQIAMRRGDWKLVNGELYNLKNDPGETTNVAAHQPEMHREMTAERQRWTEAMLRDYPQYGMGWSQPIQDWGMPK